MMQVRVRLEDAWKEKTDKGLMKRGNTHYVQQHTQDQPKKEAS